MLSRSVRDNALGSIIGGVALALLAAAAGKVSGWLPQLWDFGASGFGWLLGLLFDRFSLTLRGWAWVLVLLVVVIAGRSIVRRWLAEVPGDALDTPTWPTLDLLELSIMRALAESDGQSVSIGDLASRIQASQLRLGKALERLEASGLILPEHNLLYGTKAALTRRGRDYVLANGLGW